MQLNVHKMWITYKQMTMKNKYKEFQIYLYIFLMYKKATERVRAGCTASVLW